MRQPRLRSDDPPLDPSSGEGRRLLADELSKPEYSTQESPLRRAIRVVLDWFSGLFDGAAGDAISLWWYAGAALALVVILVLIVWALTRLQPARRATRDEEGGVFDEVGVSAADYRHRARAARDAGDFATAVVDGYRAVASGAIERFVLDDLPGMTAREIATAMAGPFPDEGGALIDAATVFGAVRYGGIAASRADADTVLGLEDRLRRSEPRALEPA